MAKEYIYAVSRIHSKEQNLLTTSDLNSLILCSDYDSCIRLLKDKGYGNEEDGNSSRLMLKAESEKTLELLNELLGDERHALDVFRYKADFHNLKLAVKATITSVDADDYIMNDGLTSPDSIIKNVAEKNFDLLPEHLRDACDMAFSTLLETGKGQLCDIIIDKACLECIHKISAASESDAIKLYGKLTVLSSNIKTAVRCAKFRKSADFTAKALADTSVIDKNELAKASADGIEGVCEYLSTTEFAYLTDSLRISVNEFEKQCDNMLTEALRQQKNDHFSIGPLVAYYLAKEAEIKAVRLILSAKLNGIDESVVKERLRELYV